MTRLCLQLPTDELNLDYVTYVASFGVACERPGVQSELFDVISTFAGHGDREAAAVSFAVVRCLRAHATLADPAPEIRRARKQALRGDADWRRRLTRLERDDTVIVALSATAIIDRGPEPAEVVPYCHEAVWIDNPMAPVDVTGSLREIAQHEFEPLTAGLRDRGVTLGGGDDIAIELVIDADLAQRLEQGRA